jgi:hypothetical protein
MTASCIRILLYFISLSFFLPAASRAWFDETHIAVAKASGYRKCYNAAGPDIAKAKLRDDKIKYEKIPDYEEQNHYFENHANKEVTAAMVLEQRRNYDTPGDREGHLYGAIVESLKRYRDGVGYREDLIAFSVHYIGDLSQPFHNAIDASPGKSLHRTNDGVVEDEVLENIGRIKEHMYDIALSPQSFDDGLAREIARVANLSRDLAGRVRQRKDGKMTKEEAYTQLGHSASLLRAVLNVLDKDNLGPCPICK